MITIVNTQPGFIEFDNSQVMDHWGVRYVATGVVIPSSTATISHLIPPAVSFTTLTLSTTAPLQPVTDLQLIVPNIFYRRSTGTWVIYPQYFGLTTFDFTTPIYVRLFAQVPDIGQFNETLFIYQSSEDFCSFNNTQVIADYIFKNLQTSECQLSEDDFNRLYALLTDTTYQSESKCGCSCK